MATVTVYRFELFDADRHRWSRDERMATLEAIHAISGVPQNSTAMVVDAALIDPQGFLRARERNGQSA